MNPSSFRGRVQAALSDGGRRSLQKQLGQLSNMWESRLHKTCLCLVFYVDGIILKPQERFLHVTVQVHNTIQPEPGLCACM